MSPFRDIEHAREFAARTLAAIPFCHHTHEGVFAGRCHAAADRARVVSDLAGIERHPRSDDGTVCLGCFEIGRDVVPVLRDYPCIEVEDHATGLVRTGGLYGEKP